MNFGRRNARLMLIMSLLAVALVACNAATSNEPAGSNAEPTVTAQEFIDESEQVGAGGSVTASADSPDYPPDESPVDVEDSNTEDTVGEEMSDDDSVDDAGDDSAEDRDADSEGDDNVDDAGDDSADDPSGEEQQDADSEGDDLEDDAGDDSAEIAEDGIMTEDNRSERQRMISELWNTDFNRHTVPYDELLALLPVRDGIIPIDFPSFETVEEADVWLTDTEPVIALEINGDTRAYPLQILTWHEIVNDTVGEIPVIVTFCPLCNSALVFDRRLNGEVYDFGTSGWLRHSDLVMWDRNTESLWQQFTGEGIVGELAGEQLVFMPSSIISFADYKEAFPEGIVLSQNTGFGRPYGQNPYPGYDSIGQDPFAFSGVPDRRIAAMERVVTVSLEDVDAAYPLLTLVDAGIISDTLGGQDLVIFHVGGTASALDSPLIAMGADVGATGVFDPNLNGQKLTFVKEDDLIVDEQSGSVWNIVGRAVDGPLSGEQLTPIVHGDHFWFSWAAFKPDTVIYRG